jgi:hypothetical protein
LDETQFRINEPQVIHQLFDDELVAVHLATGTYHSLPGTAGEILLMLGPNGAYLPEIAAELENRYDAPIEVIQSDLEKFILELQEHFIVVPATRPPSHRQAPAASSEAPRAVYSAPRLQSFTDLQELVMLDPVHDVGPAGWPHAALPNTKRETEAGTSALMRCRLAGSNIIFEQFETETVAMNLSTGAYHSLKGTAEDIFTLLPSEPTIPEILKALGTKYVVELPELESALSPFLEQLVQNDLIVMEVAGADAPVRELQLKRTDAREVFSRPMLETVAQTSFDAPGLGDHPDLSTTGPQAGEAASEKAAFDPYMRKCYSVCQDNLLFSVTGSQIVITDRDHGCYFKLNEAASDAFRILLGEPDVSQIVPALLLKYDTPAQNMRTAVMILVRNLVKLGLAMPKAGEPAPINVSDSASSASVTTLASSLARRQAFPGFDVVIYRDLEDLLMPFNTWTVSHPKPRMFHVQQFTMVMKGYIEEARSILGSSERAYSIAGQTLRIRCAGKGQSTHLQTAFEHLSADVPGQDPAPGLVIDVCDNTSVASGPLLDSLFTRLYTDWANMCGPRGEIPSLTCGPVVSIFHPGPDTLSILDRESGQAFFLLRGDAPLPFWELSSPFRHILHSWFSSRGLQYTHAGAVGGPDGGVLLVGKGGSGKSTTSLLCVSAGMQYAGDDYCLTNPDDARVFSLYNTAKLKGVEDFDRVPALRGRSFNTDSFEHGGVGKGTFNLSELWPERVAKGFPIRAILLPTLTTDVNSSLEQVSAADALLALEPSTVAQLPLSGRTDCDRLALLTEKVPAFQLKLGSDLEQIPALVRKLVG